MQRPGLEALFRRDLDALEFGLRLLRVLAPRRLRRTNLPAFLSEFRRYSTGELDFQAEARVMDRFRENLAGQDGVRIPGTYPDHTSARVLTMDWVEGMRLPEAAATLSKKTRTALVDRLVSMLLRMFVSDGLFHADLHPDNFIHDGNDIMLIDFDDSAYGWHMYDIASALTDDWWAEDFETVCVALLDGYREHRPLSKRDVEILQVFLLIRGMVTIGWFHQRPEHKGSEYFEKVKHWVLEKCRSPAP